MAGELLSLEQMIARLGHHSRSISVLKIDCKRQP